MRQKEDQRIVAAQGRVWHRVGWNARPPVARTDSARDEQPEAKSSSSAGASNRNRTERQCTGHVAVRTHSHVFAHSRVMQHMHKTVLMRAWCPGLNGTPAAEPNTGFFTELDVRLRNMHNTLAAVNERTRALRRQEQERVDASGTGGEADTLQLRQAVNSNFNLQLDFFTRCMASYAVEMRCACACPSCDCTCRQTDRVLKNLMYGMPHAHTIG